MKDERLLHEIAVEEIKKIISQKQFEDLKLSEEITKTGISFFQGRDRLCKVIKSKRGLTIEINVKLPSQFEDIDGITTISKEMAHKKHLGTMRYIYKAEKIPEVKRIMLAAVKEFQSKMKMKNEISALEG